MSHSKFKDMLIVSFDIQGVVMAECIPRSQTVKQWTYTEILTEFRK